MQNPGSARLTWLVAESDPAEPVFDREKDRRAVAGLLEASRRVSLGALRIRDLINEGRS
jgi:hypothetical protein